MSQTLQEGGLGVDVLTGHLPMRVRQIQARTGHNRSGFAPNQAVVGTVATADINGSHLPTMALQAEAGSQTGV